MNYNLSLIFSHVLRWPCIKMTPLKKLTLFGTMHFITKGSFMIYGMGGAAPPGGDAKNLDESQWRGAKNFRRVSKGEGGE